jgi:ribose transport system permease protein
MSTNDNVERRPTATFSPGEAVGRLWGATRAFRPVLVLLIALIVALSITQSEFTATKNIENMLTANSMLWVIAMGMTFVLISAGFDLSVGATAAFTSIAMAKLIGGGMPGGLGLLAAILIGAAIGAILNGVLVGLFRLSVFVVTLASMTMLTGIVTLWAGTKSFTANAPILNDLGRGEILGIPTTIWVMAAVFLIMLYLQTRTYFGRDVYALGGNMTAARLSGIPTTRTLIVIYGLVGACAGLAGALALSRIGSAGAQIDTTLPLESIAAVLLGGTALTGGSGGVGGTALGVLFIGILENGLNLSGIPSAWQSVLTGVILVIAVAGGGVGGEGLSLRGLKARFFTRQVEAPGAETPA